MNSPLSALFIAIQAHIKAHVPAIRWIDQDYGQLEFYQTRPPVTFPCAILDFDVAEYTDMGELAQSCVLEVSVRLAFDSYSPTANITPRDIRHKALEYQEVAWSLNKALHGWTPDMSDTGEYNPDEYSAEDYNVMEAYSGVFGSLTRLSSKTERREDNLRVRELRYRVAFEDYSTKRVISKVRANLVTE